MSFIAFPLRLKRAFLERCEEREAILSLIRMMAQTPHGSWAGSRHFGVRDFFEQARRQPDLPDRAVDEINQALLDLEITHYRVESIAREGPSAAEVDSYVVTLASTEPGGETFVLRV